MIKRNISFLLGADNFTHMGAVLGSKPTPLMQGKGQKSLSSSPKENRVGKRIGLRVKGEYDFPVPPTVDSLFVFMSVIFIC